MKKNMILLSVSAAMILNPLSSAWAVFTPDQAQEGVEASGQSLVVNASPEGNTVSADTRLPEAGGMTISQLEQILKQAKAQTGEGLIESLNEIRGTMEKLEALKNTRETDPFLSFTNQIQYVLISLNAVAVQAHKGSTKASTALAGLSAASAVVNSAVKIYKSNKDGFDPKMVAQEIYQQSKNLEKSGIVLSPELGSVIGQLNDVSAALDKTRTQFAESSGAYGNMQHMIAAISVGYFVLHLAAPKVAAQTDGVMGKIKDFLVKQQAKAKTGSVMGANAFAATDVLSLLSGMNTPDAQALIQSTEKNLSTAATNLQIEIDRRSKSRQGAVPN